MKEKKKKRKISDIIAGLILSEITTGYLDASLEYVF